MDLPSLLPGPAEHEQLHRGAEGHGRPGAGVSGKEAPVGKWTDSLTIEMLPEQYQPLAEILGVQPLLKLAEQYGGASLYIPKVEALVKALRDKRIQKEYNGYNAKELAQKYELSVNWVLNICKDNPLPEQQSLF